MEYTFAAERKLIFFISAGGKNRLVEFSDRDRSGASSFSTNEMTVARAIRKTSLYRRGVIVQAKGPTEEEEQSAQQMMAPKRPSKAEAWAGKKPVTEKPTPEPVSAHNEGDKVMEFPNITFAREAISKETGIPKAKLRSQAALDQAARDAGIIIKYTTN